MTNQLLAILVLTHWSQANRDERPRADPPGRIIVVRTSTLIGNTRQIRELTLLIPAPPDLDDEDEEPRLRQPRVPINLNTAVLQTENFDRWMFADAPSEADRRKHLEDALEAQIDRAALHHKLTAPQRAKLRLAGRGDIKRFFDQVEERRAQFELARKSYKAGRAALLQLAPLTQVYQEGPFGDGSLFAKTLRKIGDGHKASE
jgi:hypothetical protein